MVQNSGLTSLYHIENNLQFKGNQNIPKFLADPTEDPEVHLVGRHTMQLTTTQWHIYLASKFIKSEKVSVNHSFC